MNRNHKKNHRADQSSPLWILVLIFSLAVMAVSGWKLYGIYKDYHTSNDEYQSLEENFVSVNPTAPEKETSSSKQKEPQKKKDKKEEQYASLDIQVDLEGLQEINPDVIGWIYFENEDISYPILHSSDNDTYLRKTVYGTSAVAGSIFLDANNQPTLTDTHSIIYGHNMRNLSMFGRLKRYKDSSYYEGHEYFWIITKDMCYRYQIFAYANIDAESDLYSIFPMSSADTDFKELLTIIQQHSMLDTTDSLITSQNIDRVITLSTCTSSGNDKRFVVHGMCVEQGKRR